MLYEAIIVSMIVIATVGGSELLGMTMLNRPIVIGPLVGLALGDIHSGLLIGASLEAVFMGVVNIGGASAAEPGLATAVGTAFAITLGGGAGVALPLAIPIGILGLQVKTLLYVGVIGFFAPVFDRLAAEGKERKIVALHYGAWCLQWGIYGLLPFIGILAGSDAINAFVKMIPQVIMNGLNICGGLLPAVGMAMLLKLLWDKKIYAFFFLGFILVAYLKLPLVALAAIGAIIATTIAQRDYQVSQFSKKMSAAPAAAAPASLTGQIDAEEEDFFND